MTDTEKKYQTSREIFAAHASRAPSSPQKADQNVKKASRELSDALLQPLQQSLSKLPVRARRT